MATTSTKTVRRSIEIEPKTLNQAQINLAKEVAADVVQKMELDKVLEESGSGVSASGTEQKMGEDHVENETVTMVNERACQCSCKIIETNNESPKYSHARIIREPFSAPF